MKISTLSSFFAASVLALSIAHSANAAITVLTVPVGQPAGTPLNLTTPHTTYPVNSSTGATVILVATVPSAMGSSDSFTYQWAFGDGTTFPATAVTNPYDLSVSHQYPGSAATGTQWTATVTVTDTTTKQTGTAKYYVIQELNNIQSRVNVAIDWGLSYLHRTMWRNGTTNNTSTSGGWDTQSYSCPGVNGSAYNCLFYGSINAENVQSIEVNGHLPANASSDPYGDDAERGLSRMFVFLAPMAINSGTTDTFTYNPATASFTCKDGSVPTTTDPTCSSHGGQYFYNSGATSCPSGNCVFTFDANSNGQAIYSSDASGEPIYTTSPFLDALIASGTPAQVASAVAPTGPAGVVGLTYKNIVQDILDYYAYSQYGGDCDVTNGNTRGNAGSCAGGAWLYDPQEGDDDSTSQWAAIGFISGERGLSIPIPKITTDANNVWVTNAQDVTDSAPTGTNPFAANDNAGAYGYRGSFANSNAWGPFAVTPSGLVQMAMDGVGRTTNKAFGDSATAFDQRWNNTETFYADNFCNSITTYGNGGSNNAYYAPRGYLYGMFSFTKGMLLHDPGSSLAPITYLRTQTPGVFTTNKDPTLPANSIDWYHALSTANGGTDPCDGVAQTLISYQQNPSNGTFDGHWYGYDYNGDQFYYETAWSLIMLRQTFFNACVDNLAGQGTAAGAAPARVDLSWSNQANSTSYNILRGTATGGPYTQIGTSTKTAYTDTSGLSDGKTYFYVVQPVNGSIDICQSNQAVISVPAAPVGRK